MQIKKTGKLFSFCCSAPAIIGGRGSDLKKFKLVGENIGLLFQISDDLIDYKGKSSIAGKKTKKDAIKGKATLISLLGYKNVINYAEKIKKNTIKIVNSYGNKSKDLIDTINFIIDRQI